MIFNNEVIELDAGDLKKIQNIILQDKYEGKCVPLFVIQDEAYNAMSVVTYGWLDSRQSVLFGLEEFLYQIHEKGKEFENREETVKFIGDNFWRTGTYLEDYIYDHYSFQYYLEEHNINE